MASLRRVTQGGVYPRVGGGNGQRQDKGIAGVGLSPRGRGKRCGWNRYSRPPRSIPAWAGETRAGLQPEQNSRVYPRVGGGNPVLCGLVCGPEGLSPRGRGKLVAADASPAKGRSIPAWAGETAPYAKPGPTTGVYPRVGGGNSTRRTSPKSAPGLSPRGRGKRRRSPGPAKGRGSIPAWAGETYLDPEELQIRPVYPRVGGGNGRRPGRRPHHPGLSPRGRGKPRKLAAHRPHAGSIPAWAGETAWPRPCPHRSRVYPRVGGGNTWRKGAMRTMVGLSPRGRGKHGDFYGQMVGMGSIPAWAGETGNGLAAAQICQVYPRVGGGNGLQDLDTPTARGLSPRGRGKL